MERHNLIQEFPEYRNRIITLKLESQHFKKLFEEYNDLDNQIYQIELGEQVCSDEFLNELRLKRVHLKDHLYKQLQ